MAEVLAAPSGSWRAGARDARRSRAGPGPAAFASSAALHLLVVALIWWSRAALQRFPEFVVYELTLVEPPPAEAGEPVPAPPAPPGRPVVDRPAPEPAREAPPPPELRRTEAQPVRDTRRPEPRPRERQAEAAKPRGPSPSPHAREAGAGLNVRMEGVHTDYPEYFGNIVRQLTRYFRWRGEGEWEAEVAFIIHRDGSVTDLHWVRRSGNLAFDLEALGAVESAGRDRAFGPLPDGFPADRLPVSFYFSPAGSP